MEIQHILDIYYRKKDLCAVLKQHGRSTLKLVSSGEKILKYREKTTDIIAQTKGLSSPMSYFCQRQPVNAWQKNK